MNKKPSRFDRHGFFFSVKVLLGIILLAVAAYSGTKYLSNNTLFLGNIGSANQSKLTIVMAGDIMLDRNIRRVAENQGYDSFFAAVAPLFHSADIAVANLEGPITSTSSKTLLPGNILTNSFSFTFAPETAAVLKRAGITAVSLANNHTDNFGLWGVNETKKRLAESGVQYFGDPSNNSGTEIILAQNGMNVAFVGYHAFQGGFDRVLETVRKLSASKQVDFIIVMPHWGEEYSSVSSADLKSKARALVAAGANAVIGSHPHVIMDHEWLGDVPVFYSLGNLLFDQYFSPEVMKGNILSLELAKKNGVTTLDHLSVYETHLDPHKGVLLDPVAKVEK